MHFSLLQTRTRGIDQFHQVTLLKKQINMKYLIITSLYTSIIAVTTTQSELFPILFSTAGILLLYWFLSHSFAMRKEIAFLKEENQYFMDSFRNIRTPITLLHTPLKSTYSNNCPDNIKKELSLAIRNIDCLNDHLTRLMDLKQIAAHSQKMNITEHELGNFLKNKISSLKDHAANRHIKLEIQTEFKYASVWIDQSKISPVIEKFIKNIIDHTEYSKKVIIHASLCNKYWIIKVSYTGNENLMKCYKCSGKHLIKQKTESKYYFAKSALCKKLTEICNGEILINNSCHTITLRFPVKPSYENVSERSLVHIEKNIEEEKIDALFHKSSQKRNSSRPVVIMVDSNEEFRSYLETCLSEEYIVRGFENGADALGYIKDEHPDLVICDTVSTEWAVMNFLQG